MNFNDQAIIDELKKKDFTENNLIDPELPGSKAIVIKLPVCLPEKKAQNNSFLYDELHYGNYE